MPVPSPQEQVRLLLSVQRLLSEGSFVATYKYALLLALADLAVEVSDDSDDPLAITTLQISEKFIEYYWRQAAPFVSERCQEGIVLRQNTDRQAAVIRLLRETREKHGITIAAAQRDKGLWRKLVGAADRVVRVMPLWKLQIVGRDLFEFLYANPLTGRSITLHAGVAYNLRQFHGLITELVRGAWLRYVRQQNLSVLGDTSDLSAFLFGSERSGILAVREVLGNVQGNDCFYCHKVIPQIPDVDHFVPWSLYPIDLGHNFVLTHKACNAAKSSRLGSADHLAAWVNRNLVFGSRLNAEFDKRGILHNWEASVRIAEWAYSNAEHAGGLTWTKSDFLMPLPSTWRDALRPVG